MSTHAYAAVWSDDAERTLAGTAEIDRDALLVEGADAGRHARRRVRYAQIESVHVGRLHPDRIGGRPSLVLRLRDDPRRLRVSTPVPGALTELASAVAARVQGKGGRTMKKIVIGTDGSACALAAVHEGVELAEALDAAVTFVAVRTPPKVVWGAPVYNELVETQAQIAREAIAAARVVADEAGIDAGFEILDGQAAEAIAAVADAEDAEFTVVGSRGRGAVKGALFGSVSKALVTHSDRPVLVVKTRKPAPVAA